MSDTATRERSRLDEFAAQAPTSKGELVPQQAYQAPTEQHGALAVQVRRDEGRIRQKIRELAAMAGEEWYYRWPVKNKRDKRTDWVEGPSIKCANALVMLYGSCRVDCRFQDIGTHWVFYAQFVDYESGTEVVRPFQQRKSSGRMGDDVERNLDIAYAMGVSKAERNVVVNALQAFADFAVEQAKQALTDKIGNDLERYRRIISERVAKHVEIARVEAIVGRPAKEWLAADISRIIAMGKAIDDGMASWKDSFPPLRPDDKDDEALDKFAKDSASGQTTAPTGAGEAVAATVDPAAVAAAVKALRAEAIDKMLTLATDPEVDLEDRLSNLDQLMPHWEDKLGSHAFVKTLFDMAARVAKEKITRTEASDYLGQLP